MINIERQNIILEIINGSSSRFRQTYFKKYYSVILEEIIEFCKKISDVPFNQKVWHWVNDNPNYYLCKCGSKTTFNKNWLDGYKKSCSAKCAQSEQSTKDKRKQTTLKLYGVDNISKLEETKRKQEETNLKIYGTKSSFQNEEVKKKWKKNIQKKYGVDHIFQLEEFKNKSKQTSLNKYGVDHFVQSQEYIEKTIETNNKKYGVDWYTQTEDWLNKSIETNEEKYGVEWYTQTEEYKNYMTEILNLVIEKEIKTNLEKYGFEWYSQSEDYRVKIKEYWNKIRGTEVYDNIFNKMIETNNKKYGVDWFTQTEEYKKFLKSDQFRNSIKESTIKLSILHYEKIGFELISSNDSIVKLRGKCGHEFESLIYNFSRRYKNQIPTCTICNPLNSHQSGQELNLIDWIKSLDIDIETRKRNIIPPYELDIFIADKNIAMEYNGIYWHSEIYKDKNYHLNKMLLCQEKNIDLIQVWEDDWLNSQDIIKSIIKSRLGIINDCNRIYARKCEIKEICNRQIVNDFFDKNHIQGRTNYKNAIGLYYNDSLVSCMLFHKPKKEFELVRFANLINYSVIGSASKIFTYYINKYKIKSIISFADRSIFNGNLYNSLGFTFLYRTDPNYWWVVDGVRRHRFNYSKKKLVKEGFNYNSETEIMHSKGYFRIYGTGLDKYIFIS